jgi:hypothetical protein
MTPGMRHFFSVLQSQRCHSLNRQRSASDEPMHDGALPGTCVACQSEMVRKRNEDPRRPIVILRSSLSLPCFRSADLGVAATCVIATPGGRLTIPPLAGHLE